MFTMKLICAAATTGALLSPAAGVCQSSPQILGIQIGGRLEAPPCLTLEQKRQKRPQVAAYAEFDCIEASPLAAMRAQRAPQDAEDQTFVFRDGTAPTIVLGPRITVHTVAGRVEGLTFNTRGLSSQHDDLELLSQKFGPPTRLDRTLLASRLGPDRPSFIATWSLPWGHVSFAGAVDRADEGLVAVRSSALMAIEAAAKSAADSARKKL